MQKFLKTKNMLLHCFQTGFTALGAGKRVFQFQNKGPEPSSEKERQQKKPQEQRTQPKATDEQIRNAAEEVLNDDPYDETAHAILKALDASKAKEEGLKPASEIAADGAQRVDAAFQAQGDVPALSKGDSIGRDKGIEAVSNGGGDKENNLGRIGPIRPPLGNIEAGPQGSGGMVRVEGPKGSTTTAENMPSLTAMRDPQILAKANEAIKKGQNDIQANGIQWKIIKRPPDATVLVIDKAPSQPPAEVKKEMAAMNANPFSDVAKTVTDTRGITWNIAKQGSTVKAEAITKYAIS